MSFFEKKKYFFEDEKKGLFLSGQDKRGLRSRSGGTSLGTLLESISSDETESEEGRWNPYEGCHVCVLGLF